jgi:hypothetical protein
MFWVWLKRITCPFKRTSRALWLTYARQEEFYFSRSCYFGYSPVKGGNKEEEEEEEERYKAHAHSQSVLAWSKDGAL